MLHFAGKSKIQIAFSFRSERKIGNRHGKQTVNRYFFKSILLSLWHFLHPFPRQVTQNGFLQIYQAPVIGKSYRQGKDRFCCRINIIDIFCGITIAVDQLTILIHFYTMYIPMIHFDIFNKSFEVHYISFSVFTKVNNASA